MHAFRRGLGCTTGSRCASSNGASACGNSGRSISTAGPAGVVVAEIIVEGAHAVDIERDLFVPRLADEDGSPTLGRVPDAEFVHHIRIASGDIDDDDIAL